MGTDIKAILQWFDPETESIESEEVSTWRISADPAGEFGEHTGITVALGDDENGKDVILTEETLAALGYVPAS